MKPSSNPLKGPFLETTMAHRVQAFVGLSIVAEGQCDDLGV